MNSIVNSEDTKNSKTARILAIAFGLLVFMRGALIVWAFSFGFYRDSNLYVNLGNSLFQKGGPFSSGVVTFPYPFFNAVTDSASNPLILVWLQVLIGALAVGWLVYVLAKINPTLALVIGLLLTIDLVWGAINRNVMTEGLFVSFNILSLAFLVSHYERRGAISMWELFLVGLLYGWTFIFRPSSLFLTFLIIPLYLWFTRSWRKTAAVSGGMLAMYLVLGLFNLWSGGEFRLMGQSGYYTGSPLFVYRLFTPENGSASQQLDDYLSGCMPDVDYSNLMEPAAGGTKNNEVLYGQILPCLTSYGLSLDQTSDLITQAYVEGIKTRPIYYAAVLIREGTTFLKYNVPYILRFYLKPEQNNRCSDYDWCENIRQGRYSWGAGLPFARLYERAATKLFQIHLLLIQPLNLVLPQNSNLPFLAAWLIFIAFLLLATRGSTRFLVIACLLFIHYLILSVISGYGFLERYASILTPFYIILSGTALVTAGTLAWKAIQKYRKPG
jgi:hypothetical protein